MANDANLTVPRIPDDEPSEGGPDTTLEAEPKSGSIKGTVDPSANAGVKAPLCTRFYRVNGAAGELWYKVGAADTNWTKVV
jgi:hypothetical protein